MDLKTLNALPSITPKKNERRIGRGTGSGWGKTSGRGHKGARSRSGAKIRDYYEGGQMPLQRRFPKRGFTNAPFRTRYAILNLSDLNCFEDGAAVTPELFKKTGLIKQPLDGIKILGDGDFERKNLDITAHRFSKSAIAKLEA
ncbi:MAG: 50S ribosomal protein L15, partial [Planctomycetota bacterium]